MLSCDPDVLRAYKRVIDDGYATTFGEGSASRRPQNREHAEDGHAREDRRPACGNGARLHARAGGALADWAAPGTQTAGFERGRALCAERTKRNPRGRYAHRPISKRYSQRHWTEHPYGAFNGLHRAGCPSGISTK